MAAFSAGEKEELDQQVNPDDRIRHDRAIRFGLFCPFTWGRCYDHNFLRFLTNFGENWLF
jgi:hypothetical protein